MASNHFDVVIVGAGLSGIGAAYHLQQNCPGKTYTILEGRDAIGGTWDLFRYPGIRSDSDMYTLGYNFKPWEGEKAIADGHTIRDYIEETAEENAIRDNIRFKRMVKKAEWDSDTATWTVTTTIGKSNRKELFTCNFLMMCSGYYRYDKGYTPEFKGVDDFAGELIHPQHWPEDLDYSGKKIVVIGSGATAMTLIPSLAKKADKVTMLQRSPTYVLSMPDKDVVANLLRKYLPAGLAYTLTRIKNVSLAMFMYELSRRRPELVKKVLRAQLKQMLGNSIDIDKHFRPSYNPWDQRLCLVPNADLFKAIKAGKADVATDHIDCFVKNGIKLKSGEVLEADIIVTATGLDLVALGGAQMYVDGDKVNVGDHYSYKGMMLDGVPNAVSVIGYTNASWTLKADLTSEYTCRLLNHMDAHGYDICMANHDVNEPVTDPLLDLSSGYVQRALDKFPKQGAKAPWRVYQNYAMDLLKMRFSPVKDEHMLFYRVGEMKSQARLAS